MHEMSIVLNVFEVIREQLREKYGKNDMAVQKVNLVVGRLSSVVPDALAFSFDVAKKDTIFEKAELEIKEVPVEGACKKCKATFAINDPLFLCPSCESPDITITRGRELFIESIEIEDA